MTDIVMGNVTLLKKRIRELEEEIIRLEKVLNEIQNPPLSRYDDSGWDDSGWDGGWDWDN